MAHHSDSDHENDAHGYLVARAASMADHPSRWIGPDAAVHSIRYARRLSEQTSKLLREYDDLPAGHVVAAVARAKLLAKETNTQFALEPRPIEDQVALVTGIARARLRQARITTTEI